MASWAEFEKDRPDLATAGRALLYQFGVGLGFLATVRRDGGPRVHPMCPVIHGGGMYAFIVPGPKQADLHRDGRYALHSFPCPDNEDAFYCTGRAEADEDAGLRPSTEWLKPLGHGLHEFRVRHVARRQSEIFTGAYHLAVQFIDLRERRGMTQSELAAMTGLDQADISRIERGTESHRENPAPHRPCPRCRHPIDRADSLLRSCRVTAARLGQRGRATLGGEAACPA